MKFNDMFFLFFNFSRVYVLGIVILSALLSQAGKAEIQFIGDYCTHIGLTTNIPRPKWSATIDLEEAKRYINAFPGDLKPIAEFIVKNIQYVTQKEFENSLHQVIDDLLTKIPKNETMILASAPGVKSNWWVTNLVLEYLQRVRHKHSFNVIFLSSPEEISSFVKKNKNAAIVFSDDALYSGSQMANEIHYFLSNVKSNSIPAYVLAPYVSRKSLNYLEEAFPKGNITVLKSHIMPSFQSLLTAQGWDIDKHRSLFKLIFMPNWRWSLLTYFDHKIADEVSLLSFRGTGSGVPVLLGNIPRGDGTLMNQRIEFIKPPDIPYKRKWWADY